MALNIAISIGSKLKSVKATCDMALAGPGKDAALAHIRAAEKAHADWRDDVCVKELDAATLALA